MSSVTRNKFDVRVDLSDIQGKMLTLGKRLSTAVGRRGLLAGARVIGEEARVRAPQPRAKSRRGKAKGPAIARGDKGFWATGNLRKRIGWETRGTFRDGSGVPVGHSAVVLVKKSKGAGRNARAYAHMVEYGTQPHHMGKGAITTVFKRSKKKANPVGAMHPGAKPHPYMRPAFDAKADEARQTIARVTREELQKELAKLRSGSKTRRTAA